MSARDTAEGIEVYQPKYEISEKISSQDTSVAISWNNPDKGQ